MRKFLVLTVALALSISVQRALADTTFFTDEAAWLAAAGGNAEYFATSAENIGLANEVTSLPSDWEIVGSPLTFQATNTGLSRSFDVVALQSGSEFKYLEDLAHTDTPSLYVGQDATYEDDDWEINVLDGPPLMGFAFDLGGNHLYAPPLAEAFEVWGVDDVLLGHMDQATSPSIPMTPINESQFLGVVTTEPIGRVFFDEDIGADDIVIANFRFVPEPTTLSVLAFGIITFLRRRR